MENFLSQYGAIAMPDDCVHGVWLDKPCPDCSEEIEVGGLEEETRLVYIVVPINNYKGTVVEEDGESL